GRTMNWRRELFRLWIVDAALFVIAVAFISFSDIKQQFDDVWEIALDIPLALLILGASLGAVVVIENERIAEMLEQKQVAETLEDTGIMQGDPNRAPVCGVGSVGHDAANPLRCGKSRPALHLTTGRVGAPTRSAACLKKSPGFLRRRGPSWTA